MTTLLIIYRKMKNPSVWLAQLVHSETFDLDSVSASAKERVFIVAMRTNLESSASDRSAIQKLALSHLRWSCPDIQWVDTGEKWKF